MHIQDIFAQHPTTFSFEFFPPKTDAASEELFENIASLQALQPSFVSVTYGAGGSTRERTHDLIVRIHKETNLTAVSHLTCVCHTLPEMEAILNRYGESRISSRSGATRQKTSRISIAPRTRFGTRRRWFASSSHARTHRTNAASASVSRAFPKVIPAHRIGCWRWNTSSGKSMPGPTI